MVDEQGVVEGVRVVVVQLAALFKGQLIVALVVAVVEGILPFVEPELCALFDYKIFVDTDADERILRRILRDVKERGRSLDSVINQYLTTVSTGAGSMCCTSLLRLWLE